jgi:LacI family transcriptional regulator
VPRDISVLGFDDITLAQESFPRLSSMHVPKHTMGRLAVRRLLQIIGDEKIDFDKIVVSPRLVVRDSTGRVPKGRR